MQTMKKYWGAICQPSMKENFTRQLLSSQGSWLGLRRETCSYERPLIADLTNMHCYALCTMLYALCSMDYALSCSMHYALFSIHNALTLRRSQVSRRLDLLFAGGSKLHYCHSKDHKVASLETRGRHPRLSTGICPRKLSPLSRLFCDNILP